jgi:endoglucanase
MRGAYWAASGVNPDVAIAVDVTFASDYPGVDHKDSGQVCLGKGPVICHGSITNRKVNDLLKVCATAKGLPYQVEAYMGSTHTDADKIHFTGTGVVTTLVSLPLRYMHSPSEDCQLDDIETSIQLLAQFLCSIDENTNLDPFS